MIIAVVTMGYVDGARRPGPGGTWATCVCGRWCGGSDDVEADAAALRG